jgi:hypothetical protein
MIVLTVRPLDYGWSLQAPALRADMVFRSGAAAEQAARRLAERIARAGEPVKLVIRLKDSAVAGQFLFPPSRHPEPVDVWSRAA